MKITETVVGSKSATYLPSFIKYTLVIQSEAYRDDGEEIHTHTDVIG